MRRPEAKQAARQNSSSSSSISSARRSGFRPFHHQRPVQDRVAVGGGAGRQGDVVGAEAGADRAYMASARHGRAPNRYGPRSDPGNRRRSSRYARCSAFAPLNTRSQGGRHAGSSAGRAEMTKPECISPEMDRQWARSAALPGRKPARKSLGEVFGDGQGVPDDHVAWRRRGTRNDGDRCSSSARWWHPCRTGPRSGSRGPAIRQISQPRSDHDE